MSHVRDAFQVVDGGDSDSDVSILMLPRPSVFQSEEESTRAYDKLQDALVALHDGNDDSTHVYKGHDDADLHTAESTEMVQVMCDSPVVKDLVKGAASLDEEELDGRREWLSCALRTRLGLSNEFIELLGFLYTADERVGGLIWGNRLTPTHSWAVTHEMPEEVLQELGVERADWDAMAVGAPMATLVVAGALFVGGPCASTDDDTESEEQGGSEGHGDTAVHQDALLLVRLGLGRLVRRAHRARPSGDGDRV